jgi:hypothetical protein
MAQERWLTPPGAVNKDKLYVELIGAGIPAIGVGSDASGHPGEIRIDYTDAAASTQINANTDTVVNAHDATSPLGKFSCTTTGARLIAHIPASSTRAFLPTLIRIGVVTTTGFVAAPTVSLGSNSPNYNNVLVATSLGGAIGLTSSLALRNQALVNTNVLTSDIFLYANVSVAANATTYVLRVVVDGDYFDV